VISEILLEVHYLTDWRMLIGRHLYQVQAERKRTGNRIGSSHDTKSDSIWRKHLDLGRPNSMISPDGRTGTLGIVFPVSWNPR